MKKLKLILPLLLMASVILLPVKAIADEECDHDIDYEYISNDDGATHTIVYKCIDCGEIIDTVTEDCDFYLDSDPVANEDGITHSITYTCGDCGGQKIVSEDCEWYDTEEYIENEDGKTHSHLYECEYCDNTKIENEDCEWYDTEEYTYNEDRKTHSHLYECEYCDNTKTEDEKCTWEAEDYCISKDDGATHKQYYSCPYCYGEKAVTRDCTWKFDCSYVKKYNSSTHTIVKIYYCKKCGGEKETTVKKDHTIGWNSADSYFYYGCKTCEYMPRYNGSELYDENLTDNVSIKKGKTYSDYLYYYHSSKNKVKSITISDKSIVKVTRSGATLKIKGLKKGSCTVKVKMTSGAVYKYKVKVK